MSVGEVYFCGAMTHPGSMHVDPQPAEYCENIVEHPGDRCPEHEEPDEDDYWERLRDDRYDD